jgi:hypothetical protein
MNDSEFSWGGTDYSNILHMDGDSVPGSVSVSNYTNVIDMGSPGASNHVTCIDQDYILPYPMDLVSAIDGAISGTIKVAIYGYGTNSSSMAELSEVLIELNAIDSDGNSRSIVASTAVWSGFEHAASGNTITKAFMYWIAKRGEIRQGERVVFNVKVIGYTGAYVGNSGIAYLRIYHTKNTDELSITLPMVI